MTFDPKAMRAARAVIAGRRAAAIDAAEGLRARLCAENPRLNEIEKELRRTGAEIIRAVVDGRTDAVPPIRQKNAALRAERGELLRRAGYKADALSPDFGCKKCEDTGYIGQKPCRCLIDQYRLEQVKELSKSLRVYDDSFDSFRFEYYSEVPDGSGLSPRENIMRVYDFCVEYAGSFTPRSQNLFLNGGTGLGKTFLSACIASVVASSGFSVCYDSAAAVFRAYEEDRFGRAGGECKDNLRRYAACDLLIVDDLGTEMTTAYAMSVLYTLINGRLMDRLPTIINSNLSIDEMRQRYSPQIMSRLEGDYLTLPFFGEDIRKKRSLERLG